MRPLRRRPLWAQIWYHDLFTQYCVLVGVIVTFIVILGSALWYDPCGAGQITNHLCQQYEDGLAVGDLCYKICREKSVYLGSCVSQGNGLKIFSSPNIWIKVPEMLGLTDTDDHSHSLIPADGATIAQFRTEIVSLLDVKLGKGDHSALITNLFSFADFNQNQQLSLAEARSLWSLIQSHDFLMLFVFRESKDYFLKLNGTCGGLYAVDQIRYTQLYKKEDTYFQRMFPKSYLWGKPKWKYRANIAVGLLDFVFAVFEQDGFFYNLCDIGPHNLGYTDRYDFKALDLSSVYSNRWLKLKLPKRTCASDEDCIHTPHCSTICDKLTWECSSVLRRPNLSLVCSILQDYVLPDAPKSIHSELSRLLTKCQNVDNHVVNNNIRHMVLLQELFTLIFDQIKFDQDPYL